MVSRETRIRGRGSRGIVAALALLALGACSSLPEAPQQVSAVEVVDPAHEYRITPGDELSVFVWQDRDLSLRVKVRPDGRISMPLLEDVEASGKTPSELGRDVEQRLSAFMQRPRVTIIVADFESPADRQIRIVGEATKPQSLPYRTGMTVLDAVIAVGGLTAYADGNRAYLVRRDAQGRNTRYRVRIGDLLREGDLSANVPLLPGDVLIVPETLF